MDDAKSILAETLRQKEARRRRLVELPLGEKIAIAEELRERLQPLKNARISSRSSEPASPVPTRKK
jgi:hypothetical protein